MATYTGHDWSRRVDKATDVEDDEDDPVETMIKKTGCLDLHYKVQECMADNRDWRKCQEEVAKFRKCITDYNKRTLQQQ